MNEWCKQIENRQKDSTNIWRRTIAEEGGAFSHNKSIGTRTLMQQAKYESLVDERLTTLITTRV